MFLRRLASFALLAVLAASFTGCGSSKEGPVDNPKVDPSNLPKGSFDNKQVDPRMKGMGPKGKGE